MRLVEYSEYLDWKECDWLVGRWKQLVVDAPFARTVGVVDWTVVGQVDRAFDRAFDRTGDWAVGDLVVDDHRVVDDQELVFVGVDRVTVDPALIDQADLLAQVDRFAIVGYRQRVGQLVALVQVVIGNAFVTSVGWPSC